MALIRFGRRQHTPCSMSNTTGSVDMVMPGSVSDDDEEEEDASPSPPPSLPSPPLPSSLAPSSPPNPGLSHAHISHSSSSNSFSLPHSSQHQHVASSSSSTTTSSPGILAQTTASHSSFDGTPIGCLASDSLASTRHPVVVSKNMQQVFPPPDRGTVPPLSVLLVLLLVAAKLEKDVVVVLELKTGSTKPTIILSTSLACSSSSSTLYASVASTPRGNGTPSETDDPPRPPTLHFPSFGTANVVTLSMEFKSPPCDISQLLSSPITGLP